MRARAMRGEGRGSRARPHWASRTPGLEPRVVLGLLLAQAWQCPHATLAGSAWSGVGFPALELGRFPSSSAPSAVSSGRLELKT